MDTCDEKVMKPRNGTSEYITVKVQGQNEKILYFRIKRNTALKDLMRAYCERKSVDIFAFQFLFDGRRLHGEQTPAQVGLEDDDEIDAMVQPFGGATAVTTIIINHRKAMQM